MRPLLPLFALVFGLAPLAAAEPVVYDGTPPPHDVPMRRFGDDRFRVTGVVSASALSADGKRLAVLSTGEQRRHAIITILDAETGRPSVISRVVYDGLGVFNGAEVCFSPDGKHVAVSLNPKTAFALAADTGREVWRAKDEADALAPIAFDPAGRLLRTFSSESRAYDIPSGRVVATFPVGGVDRFTPDGKTFVKANRGGGGVLVGDLATGKVRRTLAERMALPEFTIDGDYWGQRNGLAVSHDGKTLAIAEGVLLHLIDLATGAFRRRLPISNGSLAHSSAYAVSFSHDDKTVFLARWAQPLDRWDTSTGKRLTQLKNHVHDAQWQGVWASPAGDRVFAADAWGNVELWDAATGRLNPTTSYLGRPTFSLTPDGRHLVIGDYVGRLMVAAVQGREPTRLLRKPEKIKRLDTWITNVSVSPNGQTVATVTFASQLDVVPFSGGTTRTLYDDHRAEGTALVWAADGKTLFAGPLYLPGGGYGVHQYDVTTEKMLHGFPAENLFARSVDGQGLFVAKRATEASPQQFLRWDIRRRTFSKPLFDWDFEHFSEVPRLVTPRPDSTMLAAVSGSKILLIGTAGRVFEATDVVVKDKVNESRDKEVNAIAFTPDGRWLVSGGDDCAVKVWEVGSGGLVRRFDGEDRYVFQVAIAPDGRSAFASGGDGFIRQWDLTPPYAHLKLKADDLWKATADADPATAVPAAWKLMSDATLRAVVAEKLLPVAKTDAAKVAAWVEQLDAAAFADRTAATKELAALGRGVEATLREALKKTSSAEVRQRLEELIGRFDKKYSADELRAMRLVQAAEWFRLKELLTVWAKGAASAVLTRDAAAALVRLK